ncbi:MAG: cardiolipin synthase [Lachnospiraceae bacterium]|nr:cardiolipin synthase [Lachnospiraceae bacterium]
MKKILARIMIVIPAIILQMVWYFIALGWLNNLFREHLWEILNALFSVLAVIFVTGLVAKRDESSYKLLWVMVIVAMPIFGAMLYVFWGNKNTGKKLKKNLEQSATVLSKPADIVDNECLSDIRKNDLRIGQTLEHITKTTGFPVLKNDTSKYYPLGEDMFQDMCEDLKKAQKYIYVEYFIIQRGKFWDTLTDIMAERAAAGVEVRVMYDDLGSIGTYSLSNVIDLSKKGIKCIPFNPFLFIKAQLNNRDHRKIMVIDGEIAYSGGVNLADEYINEVQKFGIWKDIGFRITGEAVRSYTYMFAEFWNAFSIDKIPKEMITQTEYETVNKDNGYILPYYDSPMYEEHVSNELFTEMLSVATDYIWFYTPYLILGDALFDAFIRAAKRGVDVRIIMPGIPDKKIVYRLSRSYYRDLLKAGVKIYEYKPGFVHAKGFVADDKIAGIGTVNLDYRSLFLHFECNSVFYNADIVGDLKQDYLKTLSECVERTLNDVKKGVVHNLIDNFLRVIAPLM